MKLNPLVAASILAAAAGGAGLRACSNGTAAPAVAPVPTPPPADLGVRRARAAAGTPIVVYVAGAVKHAGVYRIAPAARIVDAVALAGGATSDADLVRLNLAERLDDGEEVILPSKSAPAADDIAATAPHPKRKHKRRHSKHTHHHRTNSAADATTTADAPSSVVNINHADENELETLPGIGTALAQRIVAFRDLNGSFTSPDDLLDIAGMTQSRLDAIQPYITL